MKSNLNFTGLLTIFLALGLVWVKSSYGKISSGNFIQTLGQTLSKNVQSNPYSWYREFLNAVAIPNSMVFATLTVWGEFLTAVAITGGVIWLLKNPKSKLASSLLLAGLCVGIFLNLNFWLAFGWNNASADSLNLLMIAIELVGVVFMYRYRQTLE